MPCCVRPYPFGNRVWFAPLINEETNRKLTDQIKALRRALASELGFVMPSIRIQDNMQLEANEYNIYIKEVVPAGASCARLSCW